MKQLWPQPLREHEAILRVVQSSLRPTERTQKQGSFERCPILTRLTQSTAIPPTLLSSAAPARTDAANIWFSWVADMPLPVSVMAMSRKCLPCGVGRVCERQVDGGECAVKRRALVEL